MKKTIIICGVTMAALCMIAPTVGKAMTSTTDLVKDAQSEQSVEETEELVELQDDMDALLEEDGYDEKKYKELSEDIDNQKIKCEVFDYQEEVELRINTVKTAINDMTRELERGVSDEVASDINKRINKLSPIVEKYENIMKNADTDSSDYESIALQLENELSEVYEEIN